ncbi:hypothetical protein FC70_GL000501 [Paucilactobacillus oligofermentans DSM 15707 = LMG 22743]|uniref:IrrE N-terminal-like domain-containing protein n=1 Tax=Paucilactobacillus oligofermentans DSM 15707 = LMG 22743 TaxID=1423778 RepID=A0A0R1RGQ4_9LACO|nr:hypothetical protein [Paucilactobacillus oligofermentans]KRL55916.1 hypothetical protein FC70_GL000501 [Paucilactobacillus oligofermentans DSM 15707 = LMG 22743]CUS26103.1 Putative prophage repressor protein [Paucilactobacillus oligofermentans DSM 15707 = LMG 22743]
MEQTLNYLYNYAFDRGIAITITDLMELDAPSVSIGRSKAIVINTNVSNKKELPFMVAHEISHQINNDVGVLYYTTGSSRSKIEVSANNKAIDILIDCSVKNGFEQINAVKFMEEFGIPAKFENNVMNRLGNRFSI